MEIVCNLRFLPFLIGFLLPFYAPSKGNQKPVIFNFGDSNSDTGAFLITHGMVGQIPQKVLRSLSLSVPDRISDGRVILDFLCESVSAEYLSPFMESMGSNFTNGVNFAVGGSSILPVNGLFSLNGQVSQFGRFKMRSNELISKGVQDLPRGEEFANALYVIDIGQNDLDQAFTLNSYAVAVQKIPSLIVEIENSMSRLYQLGARKFWIHNTGPIGCMPMVLATRNYSASDFDQYGCIRDANKIAQVFNDQLRRLCDNIGRDKMKDATVVYTDLYAIKYDLIANSSAYGFENPLRACCGYGGGQYNYNSTIPCGSPGFQVCENRSHHVNWDGAHYTEAANKFVANKVLSGHYTTHQLAPSHFFLPVDAPPV